MLWVGEVEAASGVPGGALVAVRRHPAPVLQLVEPLAGVMDATNFPDDATATDPTRARFKVVQG